MTILYKYYKSYSKNIFINPKLKLTPPSHLNDPFERKIPHGIEAIILESHLGHFITESQKANNIHHSEKHTINMLEKTLGSIGITAMSENPDSILMWSHYADSHNGICVGYDISKINNENMRLLEIDYSAKRFEQSDITKNLLTLPSMIETIIDKVITTKSKKWSYEDEHRYITQLNYANEILIVVDKREEKKTINFLESQNGGKYLYDSLEITYDNDSVTIKAIIKRIIDPLLVEKLVGYKNISFYKNIDQDCIKEIFIGCNSEISAEDVSSVLKDNNLVNIEVNKYKVSDTEFKLEIIDND
ncbi:TPA: DUF2971 domain-containing protein [Aeromonas salmonicida subsp. pectinolytica]